MFNSLTIKQKSNQIQELIGALCQRFTNILQEIQEQENNVKYYEEQNTELKILISNERNQQKNSIENLQQQIIELQKSESDQLEIIKQSAQKKQQDEIFTNKLKELNKVNKSTQNQHFELQKSVNQQNQIVVKLKNKGASLVNSIEETNESINLIKNDIIQISEERIKLEDIYNQKQSIYNDQLQEVTEKLNYLQQNSWKKSQGQNSQKKQIKTYQSQLNQTSKMNETIKQQEKEIKKLSESLESKIKRLQIIIDTNKNLISKVQEYSITEEELQLQKTENQQIHETNQLQKIQLEQLSDQFVDDKFLAILVKKTKNQLQQKTSQRKLKQTRKFKSKPKSVYDIKSISEEFANQDEKLLAVQHQQKTDRIINNRFSLKEKQEYIHLFQESKHKSQQFKPNGRSTNKKKYKPEEQQDDIDIQMMQAPEPIQQDLAQSNSNKKESENNFDNLNLITFKDFY